MWRERASWASAAAWLNAEGCAAAVPAELAPWLAGLGYSVWVAEPERWAS